MRFKFNTKNNNYSYIIGVLYLGLMCYYFSELSLK